MDISTTPATDPEILQELGRRLRAVRKSQRLTIAEVGEAAALDRTTVSRAEHGDNPTLLTLVKMLRVYGRVASLDGFLAPPEISPMDVVRSAERRS